MTKFHEDAQVFAECQRDLYKGAATIAGNVATNAMIDAADFWRTAMDPRTYSRLFTQFMPEKPEQ